MLGGLGLQFTGGLQIRNIRQMDAYRISAQLPAQLTDGFHKWGTLYVTNGAANLGDDKV